MSSKDRMDGMLLNGPGILNYILLNPISSTPPTNSPVSKTLQFLFSIRGTLKVLKHRTVAVVLNGCKCSKIIMRISPNVIQKQSHLGMPKKGIP